METSELAWVLALSVALLAVAGFFGWRQVQALRGLAPRKADDERRFLRRQAIRRLFCCGLMVVLAGLLVGTLFLEADYQELTRELKARNERGDPAPVADADRDFARFFAGYWIALLLILFMLLALAAVDFLAVTRYGHRQHRRLEADHRAELERQLERLRHNRNGST